MFNDLNAYVFIAFSVVQSEKKLPAHLSQARYDFQAKGSRYLSHKGLEWAWLDVVTTM